MNGIINKWLYRKHKFSKISTYSITYGDTVISDLVKYVIYIRLSMYDDPKYRQRSVKKSSTLVTSQNTPAWHHARLFRH